MIVLAAYGVRQARRTYKKRKAEKAARRGEQHDADEATPELQSRNSKDELDAPTPSLPSLIRESPYSASVYSQETVADTAAAEDIRQYQKYIEHQSNRYLRKAHDPPSYDQVLADTGPSFFSSTPQGFPSSSTTDHCSDNRIPPSAHDWIHQLRYQTDPLSMNVPFYGQPQIAQSSPTQSWSQPPSSLDRLPSSTSRLSKLEELYSPLMRDQRPVSVSSDPTPSFGELDPAPSTPSSTTSTQSVPRRGNKDLRIQALVSGSESDDRQQRRPGLRQHGRTHSEVTMTSASGSRRRKRIDSSSSSSDGGGPEESSDRDSQTT